MNRESFIKKSAIIGSLPFLPNPVQSKSTLPLEPGNPLMNSPKLDNSYWYIGHLMSILVTAEDTNGMFSLIHGFEVRGLEPPPHTHTQEDESFYVIKGEIDYTVGGRVFNVNPGNWIFLPRNIQHSFKVITETAEVLMHLSPGGFEKYFIEMSEPAGEMAIPPRPQGPPDIDRLVAIASKYGIQFPKRQ